MLQVQYLNTKLNKKQINKIINNYKIKYSRIKMEIEKKINDMIDLSLKDILSFLENAEEISKHKKKINNFDKMKEELDSIKNQLKIKTYNEHKTKNELDILAQENSLLKVEIKSLKEKLKLYGNNTKMKSKPRLSSQNRNIRHSMTPTVHFKKENKSSKSLIKYSKNLRGNNNKFDLNKDSKLGIKPSKRNSTSCIISKTKKLPLKTEINDSSILDTESSKISIGKSKNKKKKQINLTKFVNNKNNKKLNKRNINIKLLKDKEDGNIKRERTNFISSSPGPIFSTIFDMNQKDKKDRSSSSKRNHSNKDNRGNSHNYSPSNSFDLMPCLNPDFEEIEKDLNTIFDEEVKQLEQDEDNIQKLLLQLNNGNLNDLILDKESGDI
jgi:hypothetical protein